MKKLPFLLLLILIGCQKDPFADSNNGTFKDSRDQLEYKWVRIGEQIWMAENLAYLPSVSQLATSSESEKLYYIYDFDGTDLGAAKKTANFQTYGVLYNWTAALVACPLGWHLPADLDWYNLMNFLSSDVGKKLKSATGWQNNGNGDNSSGFSSLPGGMRIGDIGLKHIGDASVFWTSTEGTKPFLLYRYLMDNTDNGIFLGENATKIYGLSVRCIKDN